MQSFVIMLIFTFIFSSCADVEDRLLKSVKYIGHCNVFKTNPVPDIGIKFEILISTLCLEFISKNEEDYVAALMNLKHLLKPNGTIILQVSLISTGRWD